MLRSFSYLACDLTNSKSPALPGTAGKPLLPALNACLLGDQGIVRRLLGRVLDSPVASRSQKERRTRAGVSRSTG